MAGELVNSESSVLAHHETSARVPVALGVTLGLLFIVPFLVYFRPPPIGDFHTEWLATVLFASVICAALPALKRPFPVMAGLFVMPITLAAVIGIHLLLGRYLYLYDWGLWLAYLGLFGTSMILGQGLQSAGLSAEIVNRLAWAIVLTALAQLFTQLAQVFRMEDTLRPFIVHLMDRSVCRIHGNIGQANQATTMAWFGVAGALYLMQTRRLQQVLGFLVIAMLLLSSALTASRMAWLFSGIVGLAILGYKTDGQRSVRQRLSYVLALLIGFAIADGIAVNLIRLLNPACESGLERIAEETGTLSIRWELWRQALLVWHHFPWFGSGAGGFMGWVYKLEIPGINEPLDSYAHNSLLQLLAEFGLVGASAAIGFLSWAAIRLYRARFKIDSHRLLPLVWVAILLAYSMLEFPLWYTHFLIFFGLNVGLLMNPAWGGTLLRIRPIPILGLAATLIIAGAAFAAYEYKKVERAYFLISDAMDLGVIGSKDLNQSLDQISREERLYRLHLEYALNSRVRVTKDHLEEKLATNARLIDRIPTVGPVTQEILLRTLSGDLESARRHLRRMLQFSPPGVDAGLADLRRFVKERPNEFGALGPVIDEEVQRAPKHRW